MTDILDSRALRRTDCYGQRLVKPGTYTYNVLPAHAHVISKDRPFTLNVKETARDAKMQQHNVVVRYSDRRFKVEQAEMTIAAGDMVMWNCVTANAPYVVVGDKDFFGSPRLTNECGYSHAFGTAGEYHWVDAYGGNARGIVHVKDPGLRNEADVKRWQKTLAKGTVVMIDNDRATPAEVDIVVGQTVFFAVVKGPGISITDVRLIEGKEDPYSHGKRGADKAAGRKAKPRK